MIRESRRWEDLGRLLALLVVSMLVSSCGEAERAGDPSDAVTLDEEADELVAGAREKLAAIGYTMSADVRAETRTSKQVIADLDAHQDLLSPQGAFELQHELFAALGLRVGRDSNAMRQKTVAEMARGLSAYYDPLRRAFVLLPSLTRTVSDAISGDASALVTHELVHACQDSREGGLVAFFDAEHATVDAAMARRTVIEGEAEFASLWAIAGEEAIPLLETNHRSTDLNAVFAGELTAAFYAAGRNLVLARYEAAGAEGVLGLWSHPPTSSEQALHPSKLARDLPTPVSVPAFEGLRVAHATTMGELMVGFVLRRLRVSRLDALVAAAGWDGDRLEVYDDGGETIVALVWRTVWDRAEDADDFASHIRGHGEVEVVVEDRVVDIVAADTTALRTRILSACAADRAQPDESEADAESTAAIEAVFREEIVEPTSAAGRWNHDAVGLSVPILEDWEVREVRGTQMLFHPASKSATFEVNVSVMIQPRGEFQDMEAFVQAMKDELQQHGLTVEGVALEQRGDVDVMVSEYHGRVGNLPLLHYLSLGYLTGEEQVFVTILASKDQWQTEQATLRKVLAGIEVAAH